MKTFLAAILLLSAPVPALSAIVKLSNSGICHDVSSSWYERTKSFQSYGSMPECLTAGRAYKGYSENAPEKITPVMGSRQSAGIPYDRGLYGDWIDEDADCMNTRHEVLQELSTGPVTLSEDGCWVEHGRWLDPYTNGTFSNPRDLDVDHMVPLAWAHAHGADKWPKDKRQAFANDPVNLFAVDAGTNRAKGAKGPLEWLPPNAAFQCSYVIRFERIVRNYELDYSDFERQEMAALRTKLCGK